MKDLDSKVGIDHTDHLSEVCLHYEAPSPPEELAPTPDFASFFKHHAEPNDKKRLYVNI